MREVFFNKLVLLGALFFLGQASIAQVTIGTMEPPEKGVLLQIQDQKVTSPSSATNVDNITANKGGLGLPRVHLVDRNTLEPFIQTTDVLWTATNIAETKIKHAGMMVYNIYLSPDLETDRKKIFRQGVYTWNGVEWEFTFNGNSFFYCPPFNLPLPEITQTSDPSLTYDLYKVYKDQFTKLVNTEFISSNNAIDIVPSPASNRLYLQQELDYVVTYYDDTVLTIKSISKEGVMTYDVKDTNPKSTAFINLIFIVKE